MPQNRRSYYRILHVQPDAPPEIIRASYRTLMSVMRLHPDLGGDHERAALVNEAYAVLSDPERRRAYDATRAASPRRGTPGAGAPGASARRAGSTPPRPSVPGCSFCNAPLPARGGLRCARCHAPLAPIRPPDTKSRTADRRGMPRVSKSDWAVLHLAPGLDGVTVRLRDLSLDGIGVFFGAALPVGQRVRIVGQALDVVADVVSCRKSGAVFSVHLHLVTAHFTATTGNFVETRA